MFAVIRTGGKQYRVAVDDVLRVEKLAGEAGDRVEFSEVLMLGDDKSVSIGAPLIDGATVTGEVLGQGRRRKIIVFKKKRRHTYRRRNGHRQHFTAVRITDILAEGGKAAARKTAARKDREDVVPTAEKPAGESADKGKTAAAPLFTAPEGAADDLKKISGVGPVLEKKLNALGITTFAQIAAFSAEDVARVDDSLSFHGRIEREDWIGQAKALAAGKDPGASG